jgi:hypothetical protein
MSKDTIDQSMLRPRKKRDKATIQKEAEAAAKKAATEVLEANEALATVSKVLDPDEPFAIDVTVNGEIVKAKVLKCKARQIGSVMRFLASAFNVLGITDFEEAAQAGERLKDPTTALRVVSEITDEAMQTAALMTDLPYEQFEELDLDDALALILAVWSLNQAFFLTRVLPMISDIMGRGELGKLTKQEETPKSTRKRTSTASSESSVSA